MKRTIYAALGFVLTAASLSAQTKSTPIVWPPAEASTGIREVTANERALIPLNSRIRFTTMLVLPDGEEIVDVICGDKDNWVISGTHNIVMIKPAKEGAATNLNVVATSGAIYSFLLSEGKSGQPDLKVYVAADAEKPQAAKKYYTAADIDARDQAVQAANNQVDEARALADKALAEFKAKYPSQMRHYVLSGGLNAKPFLVNAIWNDGSMTFIQMAAHELPAVYEMKDNEPALVNFQVQGQGFYVVPKILDAGYLVVGKVRIGFRPDTERGN